jgi:circadian clock protein KaiC
VVKLRGVKFVGGYHDFVIERGGLMVFPRLVAADHQTPFEPGVLPSGVPELDRLLGGGLDRGTSTLLMGPAGVGKSAISTRYALTAAERGENVAMFHFDEHLVTMSARSVGMGMDISSHLAAGRITVQQIDPAEMSPGEFVKHVQRHVEERDARVVVIDSLNGYMHSMPEERFLTIQMHELLTYLSQKGVTTFLIVAQHGIVGHMASPIDVSYLADSVLLFRFFESAGSVYKALSVMKKRGGAHETTIRQLSFSAQGVLVGKPLSGFHGILTGVPRYVGENDALSPDGHPNRS